MVTILCHAFALIAQAADSPNVLVFKQLDPPRRAAVIMALLAFTLIGVFLIAAVMIGGHWVRRLARHGRGPTLQNQSPENRRLRAALEPILPEGESSETTISKKSSDDTIAGQ